MIKTYYIFRHGLTHAVKTGTGYGEDMLTAPILEGAKKPLEKIGEYLKDKKIDYYASSPLKRCKQTAEIIAKRVGKRFVLDKRLTEFFMESDKMLEKRIKRLLKEINVNGYNRIALCTHGSVISMLITQLVTPEYNVNKYDLFHYPDPGTLVIIQDGNVSEINFNS